MTRLFWSLPHDIAPDLERLIALCQEAESLGFHGVHVDPLCADATVLAMGPARETERLVFLVTHRPGSLSPTLFVQQVNTFSLLSGGRIALHLTASSEAAEFLAVCHRFWKREWPVSFTGDRYRIEAGRINTPFSIDGPARPLVFVDVDDESLHQYADVIIYRSRPPESTPRGRAVWLTDPIAGEPLADVDYSLLRATDPDHMRHVATAVLTRDNHPKTWHHDNLETTEGNKPCH